MQINTSNILFICGGAFDGLDKIIANRVGKSVMGFGADVRSKSDANVGELLAQIMPEDLLHFGLIPEFVGRLPVVATLQQLDEEALVRILKEPKNALVKQYAKLFDMDGVHLEFEDAALHAIAHRAVERKTGARGLRAIIEEIMLGIMYDIPTRDDVNTCLITRKTVEENQEPILTLDEGRARNGIAGAKKENLSIAQ